jgi:hypothetical protein
MAWLNGALAVKLPEVFCSTAPCSHVVDQLMSAL